MHIIEGLGKTDVGRVRATNQDSLHIDNINHLYIVADGMGGHAGGEIASSLCIEEIVSFISKADFFKNLTNHRAILTKISEAINYASAKIYEKSLEVPSLRGMGTTATMALVIDDHLYIGHVGDSRLYVLRAGLLYQITFDHSLVNEQLRAGVLTEEEAKHHHLKNVITRSVGFQVEEDVDTNYFRIEPNDIVILSSDGLHGKVSDQEIAQISSESVEGTVDEFVAKANENGGEDNITVIVIRTT